MRSTSKASSAASAHRAGSTNVAGRKARGLFGLVCLCVLGFAAYLGSSAPPVGAVESFPGQGFLPDNRAWEMVSPADKIGSDIMIESSRTNASSSESPGLPTAVTFASLGGFADVAGTGIGTEFMAQRTGAAGTSGWSTHAITPVQEAMSFGAGARGLQPLYRQMTPDLTTAAFQAYSPLTDAPNVSGVTNLYLREDLRTPGEGTYRLLSDAVSPIPPFDASHPLRQPTIPSVAAMSPDGEHVAFESKLALTADAKGNYTKLYKSDGTTTRLVVATPGSCPGGVVNPLFSPGPCSAPGIGATAFKYTLRVLSEDGSRLSFTAPVISGSGAVETSRQGVMSKLFQLNDQGTAAPDDDAIVQLSASEKAVPEATLAAEYQTASVDGTRVFFTSPEQLTEEPGGGLYMWEKQDTNESQAVAVDAAGGTFTLTFRTQLSTGSGELEAGSNVVTAVSGGSFAVGQTVEAPGIPAGTTITAMGGFSFGGNSTLTLSAPATSTGAETISASLNATTDPLPFDASASQLEDALEALSNLGSGNVAVSGGPGDAGASSPYTATFRGALAGVNVAPISADASGLTGGASSAVVTTPSPVLNLTRIAPGSSVKAIDASEDGHHLYFTGGSQQLVPGGPFIKETGMYYWQDASGSPDGTLSFVGEMFSGDIAALTSIGVVSNTPRVARVTPDGRIFAFEVSDGSGLAPGRDHFSACPLGPNPNNSTGGCSQLYVYRAATSTPTQPDLVCASCPPSGAPKSNAWVNIRKGASIAGSTQHLSQALSDDGRRAFFSTFDALVPADTNGKYDAYVYDIPSGKAHLLSSGKDPLDSYFLDASDNGDDVYLITRERLTGWDTDNAYDIYDARVNGGFPEPPATQADCAGDNCKDPYATPPTAAAIGSGTLTSAGNVKGARGTSCAKDKRKVRRGGKTRCVNKKSKSKKRNAKNDRRAGR